MYLNVYPLEERFEIPKYATEGSACFDLKFQSNYESFTLAPQETALFGTGLKFLIPHNYVMNIFGRSGLASKGIQLANGVGVVDSDYINEVKVILYNASNKPYTFMYGDRIAQATLNPVTNVSLHRLYDLIVVESSNHGEGFGSTGR